VNLSCIVITKYFLPKPLYPNYEDIFVYKMLCSVGCFIQHKKHFMNSECGVLGKVNVVL